MKRAEKSGEPKRQVSPRVEAALDKIERGDIPPATTKAEREPVTLASKQPAPAPAAFPETSEPLTQSSERISFKVVNGKLDYGSLRPSNAARVKEVVQASLKDEQFKSWAGFTPATAPKIEIVTPQLVGMALDAGAWIEAGIFAKRTGLKSEEIAPLVRWTPQEHALLDPQGAALLNKYIPVAWLQYADLGVFAVTLFMMIQVKAKAVEAFAKAEAEKIGKAKSHDEPSIGKPNGSAVAEPAPDPDAARSMG